MRKYWIRIGVGALAVFAIGMIAVTVARRGLARVHHVVEGEGPVTIPLAFIPFSLDGHKLGTLDRVTLNRDSPRHVTSVELGIDLEDSLVAQGLRGCRLMANLDSDRSQKGIDIRRGSFSEGAFHCLSGDSVPPEFIEFGEAVFEPGEVRTPLFLTREMVDELQQVDDSTAAMAELQADSIADAVEQSTDSIAETANRTGDSIRRRFEGFGDSLRKEGLRRADSIRKAVGQVADSTPRQ